MVTNITNPIRYRILNTILPLHLSPPYHHPTTLHTILSPLYYYTIHKWLPILPIQYSCNILTCITINLNTFILTLTYNHHYHLIIIMYTKDMQYIYPLPLYHHITIVTVTTLPVITITPYTHTYTPMVTNITNLIYSPLTRITGATLCFLVSLPFLHYINCFIIACTHVPLFYTYT